MSIHPDTENVTQTHAKGLDANAIRLVFCEEVVDLSAGQRLTFGRSGDLIIDHNPFLHRRLGVFKFVEGLWCLANIGSAIPLVVNDSTSRSQLCIAPGRSAALTFPSATVCFEAGRSSYEILLFTSQPGLDATRPEPVLDDPATISIADLPLTDDQRRLIVALAEPTLRSGGTQVVLPPNKEAARRLGWTITRFNRKLDNVCEKLCKAGVGGLRGNVSTMAGDRRARLVEHSLRAGLITESDLGLLY